MISLNGALKDTVSHGNYMVSNAARPKEEIRLLEKASVETRGMAPVNIKSYTLGKPSPSLVHKP